MQPSRRIRLELAYRARGVAEDACAVLHFGCGRFPAARQARVEESTSVGPGREDGDRRQGAESGGVECEVRLAGSFEHHVVRVLVLCDNLGDSP